jgi:hypothetical protein
VDENTLDSLREAVDLDPNNALARLAGHLVQDKYAQQPGWQIYAKLYSTLAVKYAPQNAEVRQLRQQVLEALQKSSPSTQPTTQPATPGQ